MRLLIVEDEATLAQRIERLSREILGARLQCVTVRPTLDAARLHLSEQPVDLLLLDLNLNGQNGFQLLREAIAGAFHTVIISAHAERAIQAFEYGVLDFVPKPFGRDRLAKAFARLDATEGGAVQYLATRTLQRLDLHAVSDIRYIAGADHYTELHLANGETKLHDKALSKLLPLLPAHFLRIHKSYIVNLTYACCLHIQSGGRYTLELRGGEQLAVGRSYYRDVRARLG